MRSRNRLRISGVQKTKIIPLVTSIALLFVAVILIGINISAPKNVLASNDQKYPILSFHDPVLLSGVAGEQGAIYKFPDAAAGVDVHVEIVAFYNGAGINDVDYFTAGYYNAWQPFVKSPPNATSWVDWRITFKHAGTNIDTILTNLAATAVDVDGDGSYLKELVAANNVQAYSKLAGAQLDIIFNNDSCQALSTLANVANIDTTKTTAMFMMVFNNVSSIEYRTGAVSNYSGEHIRQNSIYFKYFNVMPTPLPVDLIKFVGMVADKTKVKLEWTTISEKNNDFYSIERSKNGRDFVEIGRVKGTGNSHVIRHYSYMDIQPFSGIGYYRLKQTDFNGQFAIYKAVVVNLNDDAATSGSISVFPNPFQESFTALIDLPDDDKLYIELSTLAGNILKSEKYDAEKGLNSIVFKSNDIVPGIYILIVRNETKIINTKQIIKI